jgi:hypothetical protein
MSAGAAMEKSLTDLGMDKKKKRPNKKTKTGCRTCRIRRVKCDEAKPNCQRCQIFGVNCDGYAEPKSKVPLKKPSPLPILPRNAAEGEPIAIPQAAHAAKRELPRLSPPLNDKVTIAQVSDQILQSSFYK